uniref:Testis expressed 36 n=1 Tax=Ursus maritimus TaxID=29073 RepID=A0A452TFY3_URSMA
MAKGRRFNPALDKDGRWFPQIGLTQKTPESSTSAMLKEPHRPHSSWQVEGKLPPIYKAREKQAVNNSFPFSVHDNRHSFQSSGCYLDSVITLLQTVPHLRFFSTYPGIVRCHLCNLTSRSLFS